MDRVWPMVDRTTRHGGKANESHPGPRPITLRSVEVYLQADLFWYESDNHTQDLSHLIKPDLCLIHSGLSSTFLKTISIIHKQNKGSNLPLSVLIFSIPYF
jgi:hypothetical protein